MSNSIDNQKPEPSKFIVDFFIEQNEERPAEGLCPKCYEFAALDALSRTRDRMVCTPCGSDEAQAVAFIARAKNGIAGLSPRDALQGIANAEAWLATWAEDGVEKAVRL